MTREEIVTAIRESECFKAEIKYAEHGGYQVDRTPRLYKDLEDGLVRVVFPALTTSIEEGAVIAITCLYDKKENYNIYAHTICAGPGVNVLLRTIFAPLGKAYPQPGEAGAKAVLHFVAWKQASWGKFLNEDLELGNAAASERWIKNFWRALDRLFAGGCLLNVPEDWYWSES